MSQTSPTGDSFYDSGSTLTVTADYTWGLANGNTRQNLFSHTLDGTTTNVTRADTGNFSTPAIIFKNPHKLTFNSVIQYLVSFHPMDNNGTKAINPSSFQIEIDDLELNIDNEGQISINLNNSDVSLNYFTIEIIRSTVLGMVAPLKGVESEIDSLRITIGK